MTRPAALAVGITVLSAACTPAPYEHFQAAAPPPSAQVELLRPAALQTEAKVGSASLATLPAGERVELVKLGDDWSSVRTAEGQEGFLRREAFARRTLVVGGPTFADLLRAVPQIDVVRVLRTSQVPHAAVGGLDRAQELARGFEVELVVGLKPQGPQGLYEVDDLAVGRVLGGGLTAAYLQYGSLEYTKEVVRDVADLVAHRPVG